MATLKYIREVKDSHLLLLGVAEEGESARYTVNAACLEAIGYPEAESELDNSQLLAIRYTDELIRAKKKALSILAFADNNKKTLGAKLYRAGFSREIIDEVLSEMLSLGYIDERRQLERIILVEANSKLRGPRKIIPALASKGYSTSDISAVLRALVDSGEVDFSRNARLLIEKKLPDTDDAEEKKKLLYKNGFKV